MINLADALWSLGLLLSKHCMIIFVLSVVDRFDLFGAKSNKEKGCECDRSVKAGNGAGSNALVNNNFGVQGNTDDIRGI